LARLALLSLDSSTGDGEIIEAQILAQQLPILGLQRMKLCC
jgi:hypothetical protein